MSYILKEAAAKDIRKKYKNSYIGEKLGLSGSYVSMILNRHKAVPKTVAYSLTKIINSEKEIQDMFDLVRR